MSRRVDVPREIAAQESRKLIVALDLDTREKPGVSLRTGRSRT